jgi:hypothetical protein
VDAVSANYCWACLVGLFEECLNPEDGSRPGWIKPCGMRFMAEPKELRSEPSHRVLSPDELTDDVSAGRKRAAMVAAILTGMTCEWAGLKFAGGGAVPILGCKDHTIAGVKGTEAAKAMGADEGGHIHHGPDKAVLNNAVGTNLHRICTTCHNRWHAANDDFYAKTRPHVSRPYLPLVPFYDHDSLSTFADEEYEIAEEWWGIPKKERDAYPYKPEGARLRLPMHDGAASLVPQDNLFELETQND